MAQLVEGTPPTREVRGSNPANRKIFFANYQLYRKDENDGIAHHKKHFFKNQLIQYLVLS